MPIDDIPFEARARTEKLRRPEMLRSLYPFVLWSLKLVVANTNPDTG